MNFFEQELGRLVKEGGVITDPVFAGRVCYGDLGGDNRAKLQFVTTGYADHYEALKVTVLNRSDGEVDSLLLRFSDIWGKKQVSNPSFSDGLVPYIWTNNGKSEWYTYRPTDADIRQLAAQVSAYLGVFTERSIAPEKAQGVTGEKTSVMQTLRSARQNPRPVKETAGHKKSGPEL